MSSILKPKYECPMLIEFDSNLEAVGNCSTGSVHATGTCDPLGYSGGYCHGGGQQGYWTCGSGTNPRYYCHEGNATTSCTDGGRAWTNQAAAAIR